MNYFETENQMKSDGPSAHNVVQSKNVGLSVSSLGVVDALSYALEDSIVSRKDGGAQKNWISFLAIAISLFVNFWFTIKRGL